jgi:alpha-L-rhamnosidase
VIAKTLTVVIAAAALAAAAGQNQNQAPPPPAARVIARAAVMTEAEEPARSIRGEDGGVFLDFGHAAFGWLRLEFPAPTPAADITVHLGEKLSGPTTVDGSPGASIAYQLVTVAVKPGSKTAEVIPSWAPKYPHWVPNPTAEKEVIPFRYAEIHGLPADVPPPRIVRMSRHVPFDETASAFDCSDRALVEVWNLCKHSIKATSFLGLYVDGNRERVAYEADAYINQLCHYGVDAHYETGRLTYEHLLDYPTWPTEWRQHLPLMALADWLYSGADDALQRNYDAIRSGLMLDRRRADGLFLGQANGVPRDIVDWPVGERDGYDMRHDVKTVTTAFHVKSLEAMATIARATGRNLEAAEFDAMREATARTMREKLFDEDRGCYVDGLDPLNDVPSRHASIHANMLPLAFGLVPEADVSRVAAFVAGRGMACSVYGSQYLLDGLFDAGKDREAVALLTATGDRGWLHMSRDVGSTITLEAWDVAYKPNLDWNHAWGAVPANVIPRKLMGIEPLEPGFARIRARPRLGGLEWATIRHPSPKGPIDLAVKSARDIWEASLELPDGVVAEVHVPTMDAGEVRFLRKGRLENLRVLRKEAGCCVVEVRGTNGTLTAKPARVAGQDVAPARHWFRE